MVPVVLVVPAVAVVDVGHDDEEVEDGSEDAENTG